MTTETAPLARAIIEDRWRMAMIGLVSYRAELGISWTNSKRYRRIDDTLQELAARLVEDGVHEDEHDGYDDSLVEVTEEIWAHIQEKLTGWAERSDVRRAAIRAAVAAEKAGTAA